MKTELPDIFQYIDYRKYLEDYYAVKKSSDAGFTHVYICRRLGQENAKTYFNNVVKGRANVSAAFIDRFIDLLELKPDPAKYFRALVNYNQTASPNEKDFFFDQLVRLNNTPRKIIDRKSYLYFREWYHSAIRAVLDVVNVNDDYKTLAGHLYNSVSVKQVKESIALLDSLQLIAKNKKGFWKPTEKVIVTGDLVKDAIVKQYQRKYLEYATTLLSDDLAPPHRCMTMTISMSDKAYERVTQRLEQVKKEIRSIVHKDEEKSTKVYHVNMNLFPLSR